MKSIIRKIKEKDYKQISELLQRNKMISDEFTKKKFNKVIHRNKGFCYVAEIDGKIVGTVFGMHDGAFHGYIGKLLVAKDYRRQKIASELVSKLVDRFKKNGIYLVFAHVEKKNKPSLKLLKSLRFEIQNSHYLIDRRLKRRSA